MLLSQCFRLGAQPRLISLKSPKFKAYRPSSSTFPFPSSQRRPSFSRDYSWSRQQTDWGWAQNPVRVVWPSFWSASAVVNICFACALYEVYRDAKKHGRQSRRDLTFDQLEANHAIEDMKNALERRELGNGPILIGSPISTWNNLSGPGQVMVSVAAANTLSLAVSYLPSYPAQRFIFGMAHIPVEGAFQNRQLLTSAFVHTGALHLAMNMLVMFNFGSRVADSTTFKGSGAHTTAFYMTSAIISSLGSHISSKFWPNKALRFSPGMGFSGVTSAIFAAWCIDNPNGRVSIFPFPGSFTAGDLFNYFLTFEVLGVLGVYNFLPLPLKLGHAAHLSGLLFGAAYVSYDRHGELWGNFRRGAFRVLKLTNAI